MKLRIPTIYCDLDGVLKDFYIAAVAAHGREITRETWPGGVSLQKLLDCPVGPRGSKAHKQFWGPILARPNFWRDVLPFPWTFELMDLLLESADEVAIVTGPASGEPDEPAEKVRWIEAQGFGCEVIICKSKWRLSHPGCLLIDDWEKQVGEFVEPPKKRAGRLGQSYLFPQPWNENHWHSADPLKATRDYLGAITDALVFQKL